ncbi:MAG: glycine cleavage system protein GcvH [Chloroflexi bacterium]|nr:glycine cleavage system protein GcvH [Chloroflexota bacterium]
MNPDDRKYTREHEWVVSEAGGGAALVGITHYAQDQLGDVVYVELPAVGDAVGYLAKMGEIESVKAVSDLFSPISGEVTEVNGRLAQEPELVNNDPFGDGWMLRVNMTDPAELDSLLDAASYEEYIGQL